MNHLIAICMDWARFRPLLGLLAVALTVLGCAPESASAADSDAERRAAIEKMYDGYRDAFPAIQELSPAEANAMLQDGDAILVDVREPEERAVSVIPGSISREEFAVLEREEDTPVIAYCTIGYRSGEFVEALAESGADAYNVRGSILAWAHEGLPLVDPSGHETKRVHVYGSKWSLLPEDYEAVY